MGSAIQDFQVFSIMKGERMKILVTGGTGLIGKHLCRRLSEQGHTLVLVTRNADRARRHLDFPCSLVEGDLQKGKLSDPSLGEVEVVFHLMGESVGEGRWTETKKQELWNSRVLATKYLRESVPQARIVISASGINYYGDRGEQELDEESPAGNDFLARLCVAWENEVGAFERSGARCVFLRTGLVITREGGALSKMLPPFRLGLGGPFGRGRQWVSWIHIDDIVGIFLHALTHSDVRGAVNAVSPHPVRHSVFASTLASVLRRPVFFSVPVFVLKTVFGEKASLVLSSQRAIPKAVVRSGYRFKFSELRKALAAELG